MINNSLTNAKKIQVTIFHRMKACLILEFKIKPIKV